MAEEISFQSEAAAEYDRAFSHVSAHFLPFLLRALRLAPGQVVLDVATGTGISAQAALDIVGPTGSVLATDISSLVACGDDDVIGIAVSGEETTLSPPDQRLGAPC